MNIRIVIADDHQIVRQGLRTLLEREADMQVVAEAEDGRRAVSLARELIPHVIVMDVEMPDLNGIEATRQILTEYPQIKIIALSMYSDRRFVTNMLKSGVSGYLLKDCAFEELVQAIRLAMSNRIYLSPGVADVVVKDYANHTPAPSQPVFRAHHPRAGGVAAFIRGQAHQPNRRSPAHQHQDGGNPPPADYAQAGHEERGRTHQIRHPGRTNLPGILIYFDRSI